MDNVYALKPFELRFSDSIGLELNTEDGWKVVNAKSCFPWSSPESHLSLLDSEGKELALLTNIEILPKPSKLAIQRAMSEAQFCFVITEIESLGEEFELWNWEVQTTSGPRQFQTKINHWPMVMPDGQVLIRDLHGDTYVIEEVKCLSPKSRKLINPLLE